jgi:hypothetical protein
MADIKDRAREYIAKHSKYSEVFGQTFVAVDTLTAMVEFAEQETKALKEQIEKMKNCKNCANYMISGKCPSFFRTGWCKNWEMAKE